MSRYFMKKIYTAQNPVIAHMVRGILETNGIVSEVRGEQLFSVRGELPMVGDTFPTVWLINEGDYSRATKLVNDFDEKMSQSVNTEKKWTCIACNEQHEVQFTSCWKCGENRT